MRRRSSLGSASTWRSSWWASFSPPSFSRLGATVGANRQVCRGAASRRAQSPRLGADLRSAPRRIARAPRSAPRPAPRRGQHGDQCARATRATASTSSPKASSRSRRPVSRSPSCRRAATSERSPSSATTNRTATVTARTDAVLYALDREDFLAAVTGHAQSAEAAETVMSARLSGLASTGYRSTAT